MTPEAKTKEKIKGVLTRLLTYWFMPVTSGFGRAGVADFAICKPVTITLEMVGTTIGRYVAIEAKAGKGNTTALQERELQAVRDAGGIALVVNETNINQLKDILDSI